MKENTMRRYFIHCLLLQMTAALSLAIAAYAQESPAQQMDGTKSRPGEGEVAPVIRKQKREG